MMQDIGDVMIVLFIFLVIVSLMTGVLEFGFTLILVSVCIVIIIYLIDRVYTD